MSKEESPATVHGRLMEAVHLSGYTLQRAKDEFIWLSKDERWKRTGYKDPAQFMATLKWKEFKWLKQDRIEMHEAAERIGASQRATAKALGVSAMTISNDVKNFTGEGKKPKKNSNVVDPGVNNFMPWFQSTADPAQALKKQEARQEKQLARQAKWQQDVESLKGVTTLEDIITRGLRFSTIVLDPPWDWGDENDVDQLGRARPTYATIPYDELFRKPIKQLAADNAHLYLWITNRSLPKGVGLLEAWGFRYVTCLTWCKPSFGMGNYFRGQSEHVLFGVRGSLPLLQNDIGTVFHAERPPEHSGKPDEFFALAQRASPPPYASLYERKDRMDSGWFCWGNL